MNSKNNIALFGWGMSTTFLLFCGLFTYIILRDGADTIRINPPDNTNVYDPLFIQLVMGGFWVAGIAVAIHQWQKPCVGAEVRPDGTVVLTLRFPFRKDRRIIPSADLQASIVRETADSEGDPYFECLLSLPDGTTVAIAEGSVREQCDDVCTRFNRAISKRHAALEMPV